jgi:hypothetical protein
MTLSNRTRNLSMCSVDVSLVLTSTSGTFGPVAIGLGIGRSRSLARCALEFATERASGCFQSGGLVQMAGSVHWWATLCMGPAR